MAESIDSDLEALVTCSICMEQFVDPRSFRCLHTFCRACIGNIRPGRFGELYCPMCNTQTDSCKLDFKAKKLIDIIARLKKIEAEQGKLKPTPSIDMNCDFKHCRNPAGRYCKDCQIKYCDTCSFKHSSKYLKETHNTERRYRYYHCEMHPSRLAVYYCINAESALCQICYLENGTDQSFIKLDDFNKKYADLQADARQLRNMVQRKRSYNLNLARIYHERSGKWKDDIKKVSSYLTTQIHDWDERFLNRISEASRDSLAIACSEEEIRSTSGFCSRLEILLEKPINYIVNEHDDYKQVVPWVEIHTHERVKPEELFCKTASPKVKPIIDQLYKTARQGFDYVLSEIRKIHDEIPEYGESVREEDEEEGGEKRKADSNNNEAIGQADLVPDVFDGSIEDWETDDDGDVKTTKIENRNYKKGQKRTKKRFEKGQKKKRKRFEKGQKRRAAPHVSVSCKRRKISTWD